MACASIPAAKQRALDLPEIMAQIGRHLTRNSLHACIQVSRAWHAFFISLIWRSLTLSAYTFVRKPSPDTLAKHAHLIRSLDFNGPVQAIYYAIGCRNLESLSMAGERASWNTHHYTSDYEKPGLRDQDPITGLVNVNPGLKRLTVVGVNPPPALEFWEAVCRMTQLESLSVSGLDIAARLMPVFWRAISFRTSELLLDRVTFLAGDQDKHANHGGMVSSDMQLDHSLPTQQHHDPPGTRQHEFIHLQKLSLFKLLGSGSGQQTMILENAPRLTTLVWKGDLTFEFPLLSFNKCLSVGRLSHLKSLDLRGGDAKLADDDLRLILGVMSRLEKLMVPNSGMASKAMNQLFRHAHTVEALDISGCAGVHSNMIQSILSSFPLLKVFVADKISVQDIMDGDPWICKGLRELKIDIELGYATMDTEAETDLEADGGLWITERSNFDSGSGSGSGLRRHQKHTTEGAIQRFERDERQQVVFERLSGLKSLEELNIIQLKDRPSPTIEQLTVGMVPKILDLRLINGLDLLRNLRRLRCFYFAGPQELSEIDVHWMMEHWKALSHISGQLNSDPTVNKELAALFRAHRVFVYGW
ncbi:hypothetical protein BGZ70_008617 [Mortierella alpina]|uniref:F-box domain-containing protein n=1 Tax=Mortierella alpina TaxID=64518 RepID=A0A9P6J355_MORAP|nr:hypothetical protein BGZ70_008617 [Mortierella alpina]